MSAAVKYPEARAEIEAQADDYEAGYQDRLEAKERAFWATEDAMRQANMPASILPAIWRETWFSGRARRCPD